MFSFRVGTFLGSERWRCSSNLTDLTLRQKQPPATLATAALSRPCPLPPFPPSFVCQALASFSPDHVGPLLDLLIAVIDQDRPAAAAEPRQSPPPASSPPSSLKKSADNDNDGGRKTKAAVASATASASATGTGDAVRRVSCAGADSRATSRSDGGGSKEERGAEEAAAGAEARGDLMQRACLRLFVTGMDLFFPSCAQRCSLLARYLSKYLR